MFKSGKSGVAWSHRTLKHIKQELKILKTLNNIQQNDDFLNPGASDLLLFNQFKIYLKQGKRAGIVRKDTKLVIIYIKIHLIGEFDKNCLY